MLALLGGCTSESMNPRPYFQAFIQHFARCFPLVTLLFLISRLQKPISTIQIALASLSLHRTSAPIQFAIVLGVLGTQEIFCI